MSPSTTKSIFLAQPTLVELAWNDPVWNCMNKHGFGSQCYTVTATLFCFAITQSRFGSSGEHISLIVNTLNQPLNLK